MYENFKLGFLLMLERYYGSKLDFEIYIITELDFNSENLNLEIDYIVIINMK